MKKQTSIYTVKVEQTIFQAYSIQAQTREEALRTAAELWGMDKNNHHEDNAWSVAEQKITDENNQPSTSELEYVDNK